MILRLVPLLIIQNLTDRKKTIVLSSQLPKYGRIHTLYLYRIERLASRKISVDYCGLRPCKKHKKGLYRTNQYRPATKAFSVCTLYRDSRMSSMYMVPEPPDAAIPALSPRPIANVSTLVRLMPRSANACNGITHCDQKLFPAVLGSS